MTAYSKMHPALEKGILTLWHLNSKKNLAIESMHVRTPCNGLKLHSPGEE